MKYYRLIDKNQNNWPGMEIGRIYPEHIKVDDDASAFIEDYVRDWPEDWQEESESEYLIQEAKERYPVGTIFVCLNTIAEATVSTGIFKEGSGGGINEISSTGDLLTTHGAYHCIYDRGKWARIISKPKQEMEELKITKERVLSAAEKFSTAKATLKELFPEVFEGNYIEKLGRTNKNELLESLKDAVDDGIPARFVDIIPGTTKLDKAESIAKLIYETWIKE